MRYLVILLIGLNVTFAQMANGMKTPEMTILNISEGRGFTSFEGNLNSLGKNEKIEGESIVKLANNEYWIKNSEMRSGNGDIYSFAGSLLKNGKSIIEQVKAEYGYVLVITPNSHEAVVYLAGPNGAKASDPVSIEL
jgi:hypothetical protein